MRAAFGIKLGRNSRSESIWGICADRYAFLAVEQTCARHPQPSQASKPKTFHAELEKKRKHYAFWHQFNEKPSIIPGCPGHAELNNVSIEVVLN